MNNKISRALQQLEDLCDTTSNPKSAALLTRAEEELRRHNYSGAFAMLIPLYALESRHKEAIIQLEDEIDLLYQEDSQTELRILVDGEQLDDFAMDRFLKLISESVPIKEALNTILHEVHAEQGSYVVMDYFGTTHAFTFKRERKKDIEEPSGRPLLYRPPKQ